MKIKTSLTVLLLLFASVVHATMIIPLPKEENILTKFLSIIERCNWHISCYQEERSKEEKLGATVTTINGTDTLKDSRSVINTNFANLNTDKTEVSTTSVGNITGLPNLATVGNITTGTWGATAIATAQGGTNNTSFSGSQLVASNNAGTTLQSTSTPTVTGITTTRATTTNATTTTLSIGTISGTNGVRFTIPTTDGTNGQAVTTNGVGTLSFTTISGGGSLSTTSGQALNANDWVFFATTTAAAANTSIAANDGSADAFGRASAGAEMLANCDKQTTSRLLTNIQLSLAKTGTPTDNAVMEITGGAITGGSTAATSTVASSTIAGTTLTGSVTRYNFGLFPGIYVPANETYCIRMKRSGAEDNTNYYNWERNTANPSATITGARYSSGGDSWDTSNNIDYVMQTTDSGSTAGRAYIASAAWLTEATSTIGIVNATVSTSSSATVLSSGMSSGWSSLTANKYFTLPACLRCNGDTSAFNTGSQPNSLQVFSGIATVTVGWSPSNDVLSISTKDK